MDVDAIMLARIQFAFTITFHIIFPSLSIGLAAFIATLLVRWRITGEDHFHRLARFWTKIFAVSFAMGVVSGIVLSYQIGTNWARFSVVAGNIIGPLLNPAKPQCQLTGVYQREWCPAFAEILQRLGRESAWVVHGTTGADQRFGKFWTDEPRLESLGNG